MYGLEFLIRYCLVVSIVFSMISQCSLNLPQKKCHKLCTLNWRTIISIKSTICARNIAEKKRYYVDCCLKDLPSSAMHIQFDVTFASFLSCIQVFVKISLKWNCVDLTFKIYKSISVCLLNSSDSWSIKASVVEFDSYYLYFSMSSCIIILLWAEYTSKSRRITTKNVKEKSRCNPIRNQPRWEKKKNLIIDIFYREWMNEFSAETISHFTTILAVLCSIISHLFYRIFHT